MKLIGSAPDIGKMGNLRTAGVPKGDPKGGIKKISAPQAHLIRIMGKMIGNSAPQACPS